jgi:hypothetical protein
MCALVLKIMNLKMMKSFRVRWKGQQTLLDLKVAESSSHAHLPHSGAWELLDFKREKWKAKPINSLLSPAVRWTHNTSEIWAGWR